MKKMYKKHQIIYFHIYITLKIFEVYVYVDVNKCNFTVFQY